MLGLRSTKSNWFEMASLPKVIGSNGISTIGARGAKLGDGWGDGSVSSCLGLTGGVVASRPLAWSERAVAERQSRCILTAELVPQMSAIVNPPEISLQPIVESSCCGSGRPQRLTSCVFSSLTDVDAGIVISYS